MTSDRGSDGWQLGAQFVTPGNAIGPDREVIKLCGNFLDLETDYRPAVYNEPEDSPARRSR